ncbi:pentapeptide repeat-containing protein [Streptomyces sp. NPDC051180]|uniref:pentapeptide repeat-containing protein n=1 Tax=Streptomyces sp. NPDC051180 TaxID=3155797 RepID=UPI00344D9638
MTDRPSNGRLHRILRRRGSRRPGPERGGTGDAPSRLSLLLLSLPGLAAVAALLFTWLQVGQTGKELRIIEEGQITTRFNTAVVNLGSDSVDVRLGGIYALERIMKDSPPDQGSVVSVLSAYMRRHSPVRPGGAPSDPSVDAVAAMNVLVRRRPEHDQGLSVVLSGVNLRGWAPAQPIAAGARRVVHLREAVLSGADPRDTEFLDADLRGAELDHADLSGADMTFTNLAEASLERARLRDTAFNGSDLTDVRFCLDSGQCAELTGTDLSGADLSGASFPGADLRKAVFCSDVFLQRVGGEDPASEGRCASLRTADLTAADLSGVDLAGADLTGADLTGANLTGADLTNARLDGAVLTETRGLPPSRTTAP